jgi:DNA helicase II / ATP-dependent DNA helicase PcrA
MKQTADLHIHSRFSRACSRDLTLVNIDKTCRIKGVDIIATGDFTYPDWFKEIENELEETGKNSGLYKLKKSEIDDVKFVLSTEVALIYKKYGKVRRIHVVILAPDISSARELNLYLDKKYNIRSDGRPILGMDAEELVRICLSINPKFVIFPAHIWTPWFAVFGSKSGFDRMEECFGEYTKYIHAYETGLSSDPEMNWRLSSLDDYALLSNSDAHSLLNIAREANIFNLEKINFDEIRKALQKNDKSGSCISSTIEFFPEEGMYHYDGHRICGVGFNPDETKKLKSLCPVCKKPLIIGVMNRAYELADRPAGFRPENAPSFMKIVELDKIIAQSLGVKSRSSKKVKMEYDEMIGRFGSELKILTEEPIENIISAGKHRLAEGIKRVREGELNIKPGYDGKYGEIGIF